jgi:hypothetical protein
MSDGLVLSDTHHCHICPDQLLNQQPLIFSFLSFVAYLAGIDFLDLTPEGSLLRQRLFAQLHPAFTSFPFKLYLKYEREKGLSRRPRRRPDASIEGGPMGPPLRGIFIFGARTGFLACATSFTAYFLLSLDLGQFLQGFLDHLVGVEFDILQFAF